MAATEMAEQEEAATKESKIANSCKVKASNSNEALNALVSAAFALPGITSLDASAQGVRADDYQLSYHHARYSESGDRMDVDVNQLSLTLPVGERYELAFAGIRDVTSGASPVLNLPDAQGQAFQILQSGASIRDRRDVNELSAGRYADRYYTALKLGQSKEDDYESDFVSLQYSHYFNKKNTQISVGAGYNRDDVWNTFNPVDPFTSPTVVRVKRQRDLLLGLSQLIDKKSSVQINISHSRRSGYLSDPYKKVYIADKDVLGTGTLIQSLGGIAGFTDFMNSGPLAGVNLSAAFELGGVFVDSRPDERVQTNILLRYSRYLGISDSAIHVDYRYSFDDWDTDARTAEINWRKALGHGWIVSPSLRYYTQHNANFYQVTFIEIPRSGHYTSDYRLSGFGALSGKVKLIKSFGENWRIRLAYEYYERKQDYEWNTGSRGDSLDDYHSSVFSFAIEMGTL